MAAPSLPNWISSDYMNMMRALIHQNPDSVPYTPEAWKIVSNPGFHEQKDWYTANKLYLGEDEVTYPSPKIQELKTNFGDYNFSFYAEGQRDPVFCPLHATNNLIQRKAMSPERLLYVLKDAYPTDYNSVMERGDFVQSTPDVLMATAANMGLFLLSIALTSTSSRHSEEEKYLAKTAEMLKDNAIRELIYEIGGFIILRTSGSNVVNSGHYYTCYRVGKLCNVPPKYRGDLEDAWVTVDSLATDANSMLKVSLSGTFDLYETVKSVLSRSSGRSEILLPLCPILRMGASGRVEVDSTYRLSAVCGELIKASCYASGTNSGEFFCGRIHLPKLVELLKGGITSEYFTSHMGLGFASALHDIRTMVPEALSMSAKRVASLKRALKKLNQEGPEGAVMVGTLSAKNVRQLLKPGGFLDPKQEEMVLKCVKKALRIRGIWSGITPSVVHAALGVTSDDVHSIRTYYTCIIMYALLNPIMDEDSLKVTDILSIVESVIKMTKFEAEISAYVAEVQKEILAYNPRSLIDLTALQESTVATIIRAVNTQFATYFQPNWKSVQWFKATYKADAVTNMAKFRSAMWNFFKVTSASRVDHRELDRMRKSNIIFDVINIDNTTPIYNHLLHRLSPSDVLKEYGYRESAAAAIRPVTFGQTFEDRINDIKRGMNIQQQGRK